MSMYAGIQGFPLYMCGSLLLPNMDLRPFIGFLIEVKLVCLP